MSWCDTAAVVATFVAVALALTACLVTTHTHFKYKSGAKEAGAQAGLSQRGNSSRSLSEGVPPKASMSQFSSPKRGVPKRYGGTVQRRHVHVYVCASR